MGLDWALLERAADGIGGPVLRLYGWDPACLSLGRFQAEEGLPARARGLGFDAVRRPTGGRAVLHQHELTYSVVLPPAVVGEAGIRTSYAVLSGALNAALGAAFPVSAPPPGPQQPGGSPANCFAAAAECDTLVAGRKLVGSAQVRRQGALLQHGSLLLAREPGAWEALFGGAGAPLTLAELTGESDPDALRARAAAVLRCAFAGLGGSWTVSHPEPSEEAAAGSAAARFRL